MTDEQWGPWIEHDGSGCPVRAGTVVHAIGDCGSEEIGTVTPMAVSPDSGRTSHWHWAMWSAYMLACHERVIRYRVKKPRGLAICESILSEGSKPAMEEA